MEWLPKKEDMSVELRMSLRDALRLCLVELLLYSLKNGFSY